MKTLHPENRIYLFILNYMCHYGGNKKMNKTLSGKMLVIGCILLLLGASTIAVAIQNQPNENETVKINVYDTTSKKVIKSTYYLSVEQAQKIIEAFLEKEMTLNSFNEQIKDRLSILQDNGLISVKTATALTKTITARQQLLTNRNIQSRPAALFDVANFINIVIFGLKGDKVASFLELNPFQMKFLNGTISGYITFASKFTGNGSVFSLGLLGWRYSYGHNQTKYPVFPHFPSITGSVFWFLGIYIDVESAQPGYPGHYILGVGTSLITIWNQAE